MKFLKRFESHEEGMSREAMCDMLCKCGYTMEELEGCSNYELAEMCRTASQESTGETNEAKGEKWITYAIKRGALRKKMNKEEGEKITASTLKGLKEHQEQNNYMFFGNLETMKNMIDELLQMDESKIDAILNEHDWASDHISVANENLEHVYNFLKNHGNPNDELIGGPKAAYPTPTDSEPSFDETEGQLANKDLESEIKSFKNFK